MEKVYVAAHASDRLTFAGLDAYLAARPETILVPADAPRVDVALFVTGEVSSRTIGELREFMPGFRIPTVLVADELDERSLLTVVGCHVVGALPRRTATRQLVLRSLLAAAAGDGFMTSELLGMLLTGIRSLQRDVLAPLGLNADGMQTREVEVLRLLAKGLDDAEIGERLSYSERTVKGIIYEIIGRFNLRNRPHAVAHALRSGII
ncbi:helix-turn-helix transcriptional regulator [Amycolatopsis sp.]|jgi:DNA-binding NarL/FixJ family response regulator|uniref:helix-turn-helix transcriptional regulator n=1 Tax=Amycolatopsis sp. TaxID=37632 RepID=UPI002DFF89DC|nr:LuxR C-terminal-related transcriptional regulator [Amycolatopsis sp.]